MTDYPILPDDIDRWTSMDPAAVRWRRAFAAMNNAIEDCPTDPGAMALRIRMDAEGITGEERQTRLNAYLNERIAGARALQAECDATGIPDALTDTYVRAFYEAGPPAKSLAEVIEHQLV